MSSPIQITFTGSVLELWAELQAALDPTQLEALAACARGSFPDQKVAIVPRQSAEATAREIFPKWESSARTMAEWVFALYREDTSAIEAGKPEPIQLDFIPKPVVDASMWVLNKNEREPGVALPLVPPKSKTPLDVARERLAIGIRAIVELAEHCGDSAVRMRAAEQLIETYMPLVESGEGTPDVSEQPKKAQPELRERIMEAFRNRTPLGFDEIIILAGDNAAIIAEVEKMAAEGVIEHAPGHSPGHFRPVYRGGSREQRVVIAEGKVQTISKPIDTRPGNCRERLREEGQAYPKSGCSACSFSPFAMVGGGCAYERPEPTS